jgi:hypothetical protein
MNKMSASIVTVFGAVSCGGPVPPAAHASETETSAAAPIPSAASAPVVVQGAAPVSTQAAADVRAAQMLIISDTHTATPMALHKLQSNSPSQDARFGAAMRPPQLEEWSISILEWILRQPRRPKVIVHLGDVANVACRGEYSRFANLMKTEVTGTDRWYLAPGNHDTLVMGNWAYLADAPPKDFYIKPNPWNRECDRIEPNGSMDKKVFFEDYLASKGWGQEAAVTLKEPRGLTCANVTTHDEAAQAEVCWREPSDKTRYWWFLLQKIKVDDDTTIVLLDTTQYATVPVGLGGRNPGGVKGGIGWEQLEEARKWLKDKPPGKHLVLAGHFPIDSLDKKSKKRLQEFIAETHALTYLSGHIHAPSNERIHDHMGGFLEINMASTMGWPMEFGYLSVRDADKAGSDVELSIARVPAMLLAECSALVSSTMEQPDSAAYYMAYRLKKGKGWIDNYDQVRAAMYRNLQTRLSTDLTTLGKSQESFETFVQNELTRGARPRELASEDDLKKPEIATAVAHIEAYERCQAIWASYAESNPPEPPTPTLWRRLPGVSWVLAQFDDPKPKQSKLLGDPEKPVANWHWTVTPPQSTPTPSSSQ